MTRIAGKISIWLGIGIILIVGVLAALSAVGAGGNSEVLGWLFILGFLIGLPVLIIGGFLILAGTVLTSLPKNAESTAPPEMFAPAAPARAAAATNDPLRAALTQRPDLFPDRQRLIAWTLRGLALLVFAWMFIPQLVTMTELASMMPDTPVWMLALIFSADFIYAALIPLILLLVSNVLLRQCRG